MKKFLCALIPCFIACLCLSGCGKKTDYFNYVSEYRSAVYYFEDDNLELKIYAVERENPFALDGIKGQTGKLCEVYLNMDDTANEVEISLLGKGGNMSYLAVSRSYYLSFAQDKIEGASVEVSLTIDGKERKLTAQDVAAEGTIDGKTALKCVTEYDEEGFTSLTQNGAFMGEIHLRLLYDDGCYYYVGVCNRGGEVHAYLVDGESGRIIAERQSEA